MPVETDHVYPDYCDEQDRGADVQKLADGGGLHTKSSPTGPAEQEEGGSLKSK